MAYPKTQVVITMEHLSEDEESERDSSAERNPLELSEWNPLEMQERMQAAGGSQPETMEVEVDPSIYQGAPPQQYDTEDSEEEPLIWKKKNAAINDEFKSIQQYKLEQGPPYDCPFCDKKIFNIEVFKQHLPTHKLEKNYSCDVCEKKFVVAKSLKIHMRSHTGEKPYPCTHCEKKFTESGSLSKHLLMHTGEKPHACHLCEQKFARSTSLKIHIRSHTGYKPFACELCDRRFTESKSLTRHGLSHSIETPYECKHCEQKFENKESWQEHVKEHSGLTPYECFICKVGFEQLKGLRKHNVMHRDERFLCSHCAKVFPDKRALAVHVKRQHIDDRPHKCTVCTDSFVTDKGLLRHMKSHGFMTSINFPFCILDPVNDDANAASVAPLKKRKKKLKEKIKRKRAKRELKIQDDRTFQCKICKKEFGNNHSLTIHFRIHSGEKPFECGQCGKRFITSSKLTRHRKTHTGERPYQCSICFKCFSRPGFVKTHMKVHRKNLNDDSEYI